MTQYSPPKMPWYKSAIERYFGALNSQLLSDAPGKTFSNFLQLSDYDPKKNAVISFEALQEILHIFIVDIHNQSSHPSLKSPRSKVWELAINEWTPALPPSNQELKVLVGSITTRKVTRRGVEFEGLLYNSSELARLRSSLQSTQKATVKYDPTDLSRIYVLDPTTHQFLEVPALSLEYTKGLTLLSLTNKQASRLGVPAYKRLSPVLETCCLLLSANESYQDAETDLETLTLGEGRAQHAASTSADS